MAVKRITIVTKQELMPKLISGPIHIILKPNLGIKNQKNVYMKEKK